jgi:hypothetical protein
MLFLINDQGLTPFPPLIQTNKESVNVKSVPKVLYVIIPDFVDFGQVSQGVNAIDWAILFNRPGSWKNV